MGCTSLDSITGKRTAKHPQSKNTVSLRNARRQITSKRCSYSWVHDRNDAYSGKREAGHSAVGRSPRESSISSSDFPKHLFDVTWICRRHLPGAVSTGTSCLPGASPVGLHQMSATPRCDGVIFLLFFVRVPTGLPGGGLLGTTAGCLNEASLVSFCWMF